MADSRDSTSAHDDESFKAAEDVVARILARQGTALASTRFQDTTHDAGDLEREARAGMRRVNDIASQTELDEVSEVEYRQVRLERVVLVGLRTTQSLEEAENSLR